MTWTARSRRLLLACLLACASFLVDSAPSWASGPQLLTDSGFTDDTDGNGVADGWTPYGPLTFFDFARDGQTMSPTAGSTAALSQNVSASPGLTYQASAEIVTGDLAGGQVVLKAEWFDASSALITYDYVGYTVSSSSTTMVHTWTAPARSARVTLTLGMEGGGTVSVRSIGLVDTASAPSSSPAPTGSTSPSPSPSPSSSAAVSSSASPTPSASSTAAPSPTSSAGAGVPLSPVHAQGTSAVVLDGQQYATLVGGVSLLLLVTSALLASQLRRP